MSARVERDVALYISGMNEAERVTLAAALYFNRVPDPHGDDTDQINTYKDAIDKVAEGPCH